jgi:hypothetical protein
VAFHAALLASYQRFVSELATKVRIIALSIVLLLDCHATLSSPAVIMAPQAQYT